jgi:hypothetical protein
MRAIRVLGASGLSSRFGGLSLVSAGLCRAMGFAPFAVIVVPPEHFLQDGIDDVVGVALDKARVVFQEFIDRLFQSDFSGRNFWCFLNDRHGVPPLLMRVCSELPVTAEKTPGTIQRAAGRERPHELFGRLKAEKVGSLPPDLVFFSQ